MRNSLIAALLGSAAAPAFAQDSHYANTAAQPPARVVTVIPGKEYAAGALRRMVLGTQYRDLWATAIEVPLLDLEHFAGGLKPEKRSGSRQTIGLRFKAGDGLEYNFRSVDKEPANALPPALKGSLVEKVFQDQMSAQYPAAAIIASALLDAAGVLHPHPHLYVLPDDPRLGEFQAEFAGLLGTIEEHRPRFSGARQIVETQELFDSLRVNANQHVAAREYLKARLMDVFIGDWDRHADQWQWAAFSDGPGEIAWRPVPEDRDWAFAKMDGPIATIVRQYYPQTIGFSRDYPAILDLTWTAKDLDRRLLSELERPTWDSVVTELQGALTDSVIHQAVLKQPEPLHRKAGAWLEDALQHRRDELPHAARDFYGLLNEEVDVHATDVPDSADVHYEPSGSVYLTIQPRSSRGGPPWFARRFNPAETHEVRLYLHGGEDVAFTHGKPGRIRVRVIGGEIDRLIDSARNLSFMYPDRTALMPQSDPPGDNGKKEKKKKDEKEGKKIEKSDQESGPYAPEVMNSETFGPLPRDADFLKSSAIDWGHRWTGLPWVEYHPGQGLSIGYQVSRFTYGFRAFPYRKRFKIKAGWAFAAMGPRVESYAEDRHFLQFFHDRVPIGGRIDLKASKVETVRFFGFGNQTVLPDPYSSARYIEDYLRIAPSLFYDGARLGVAIAPMVQLTRPRQVFGSLLETVAPTGVGQLVLAGIDGSAAWNVGPPVGNGTGGRIKVESRWARSVSGAPAHFFRGGVEVAGFTSVPLPTNPTLTVRTGAIKVWGLFPFQEAALLGGQRNLRGYHTGRFAGDAATYVGTDLRFPLVRLRGFQAGVMALADAGRVYLDGETSSTWHKGFGGGIWGGSPDLVMFNLEIGYGEDVTVNVYTGIGF